MGGVKGEGLDGGLIVCGLRNSAKKFGFYFGDIHDGNHMISCRKNTLTVVCMLDHRRQKGECECTCQDIVAGIQVAWMKMC